MPQHVHTAVSHQQVAKSTRAYDETTSISSRVDKSEDNLIVTGGIPSGELAILPYLLTFERVSYVGFVYPEFKADDLLLIVVVCGCENTK